MFYISLNDAVIELCKVGLGTKFHEKFLDRMSIRIDEYMYQLLIDYIWGSYINLYGVKCFKGKKCSGKHEIVSRDYLPMGGQHKYKWNVNYKIKSVKNTYEFVSHINLDKKKSDMIAEILKKSSRWERKEIATLDLNSILSFNNELLYTDISMKKTDLAFLSGNLESYLMGIFSKDEKKEPKKTFSIMKFIKFWKKDKESTSNLE